MDGMVLAIDENGLATLVSEIRKSKNTLEEYSTQFAEKITKIDDIYQSDTSSDLSEYLRSFQKNFNIIQNNLSLYADDLECLVQRMKENDNYMAGILNDAKDRVDTQTKASELDNLQKMSSSNQNKSEDLYKKKESEN